MPETCFYKIDYQHHSSTSFAFDEMHAAAIVEAPKDIYFDKLDSLCRQKIPGVLAAEQVPSSLYPQARLTKGSDR